MAQQPLYTPPSRPRNGSGDPLAEALYNLNDQISQVMSNAGSNFTDLYLGAGGTGKWVTGKSYTGLVGTRGMIMGDVIGGTQQFNSRSIHVARSNITQIGALIAGWIVTTAHSPFGEFAIGDDSVIHCGIEYPLGGTVYPLTWGGQASGTVYNGATQPTDLITIPGGIPAGAQFAYREYRVVGANGSIPWNGNGSILANTAAGDSFEYGSSLTNRSGTAGTFTNTASGVWYRPVGLFGPTNTPSYACIGDSRVVGLQDDGTTSLDLGEIARSVGAKRAYTNLGLVGEMITTVMGYGALIGNLQGYSQRAAIIKNYCTHVICNYGVNDVINNITTQPILQALYQLRGMFPNQYFYQTTQMPAVNGSTPTVPAGSPFTTVGTALNNHFLSGVTGFDGVFDVASALKPSRSVLAYANAAWCSNDGIHESPAGYSQIASSGVITVQ
jgi:hypothetical protein